MKIVSHMELIKTPPSLKAAEDLFLGNIEKKGYKLVGGVNSQWQFDLFKEPDVFVWAAIYKESNKK